MSEAYEKGHIRHDRGLFIDKGNYAFDPRHPDFAGGADPEASKDSYHALLDCDTEAAAAGAACVLGPGAYIVNSDLTLATHWWVEKGVTLKPADGVVIVFGGGVTAGPYDWIDESAGGTIVVANDGTPQAFRQWRGAADDRPACPFTWNGEHPLPDVLYIKADGTAYIDPDYDVADFAPAGTVAYYVDFVSGNDANPGTEAEPLKHIDAAILKSDVDIIYLHTGAPHKDEITWTNLTRSVKWYPYGGGERAVIVDTNAYTWTKTGGLTNVYQTTQQDTLSMVLDAGVVDENGDFYEMTLVADTATVDSTPGSYYIDGNTLYVHTADSRAADADVWPMRTSGSHVLPQSQTQYMENISIYGGARCLLVSKDATFIGKGVHLKYSSSADGLEAVGAAGVYLQNCVIARNQTDGCSYRPSTTIPVVLELNCTSRHNGLRASSNTNNGSSGHAGSKIVRINGTYWMNKGPNVVDVGGSESWNVGCTVYDSASGTGSTDADKRQQSNFYVQDGHMWIEGGESKPRPNGTAGEMSLFDFVAQRGYIHIRNVRHGHQIDTAAESPNVIGAF